MIGGGHAHCLQRLGSLGEIAVAGGCHRRLRHGSGQHVIAEGDFHPRSADACPAQAAAIGRRRVLGLGRLIRIARARVDFLRSRGHHCLTVVGASQTLGLDVVLERGAPGAVRRGHGPSVRETQADRGGPPAGSRRHDHEPMCGLRREQGRLDESIHSSLRAQIEGRNPIAAQLEVDKPGPLNQIEICGRSLGQIH